jgi:hypothetical protein
MPIDCERRKKVALEGYTVKKVTRKDVSAFIEKWHYSHSINGCIADFCYALFNPEGLMVGAMFYGRMAMANQWKRFSDKESDVIELRRLCCIDDTPKNAESFLIGRSLRLLSKEWNGRFVVSYSDKEYNHQGTIYKASNFKQLEDIKGARIIIYNGKHYHDKAIRTKYKGELKPFAKRIKEALESGQAYYKETAGKCTYVYELRV